MAIAYDNATASGDASGSTTLTFSHTCTGSNLYLIVHIYSQSGAGATGVTYNGTAMTRLSAANDIDEIWGLVNPATGANNVVASRASGTGSFLGGAISYTGVAQSSSIGNKDSGNYYDEANKTDSSTTPHRHFTTANDNSIIVVGCWNDGDTTSDASGTGHTKRWGTTYFTGGKAFGTTKTTTAAGSYQLDFTISSANIVYCLCVELKELVIVAPTVTTQAGDQITSTGFRGNGNITATGGANATRRGFCYKAASSGDPTTSDSTAYDDGSFGTGAYTKAISGLSSGTNYRVRAYAVNSAGTAYGSTVNVETSSSGPANVKTYKGLAASFVKSKKGLVIASIKSAKGLN